MRIWRLALKINTSLGRNKIKPVHCPERKARSCWCRNQVGRSGRLRGAPCSAAAVGSEGGRGHWTARWDSWAAPRSAAEGRAGRGARCPESGCRRCPGPGASHSGRAGAAGTRPPLDPGSPQLAVAPSTAPTLGGPGWSRERGARGSSFASQARGGEAPPSTPPRGEPRSPPPSRAQPLLRPPALSRPPSATKRPNPVPWRQGAESAALRLCGTPASPHLLPGPSRGAATRGGSGARQHPETPSRRVARCHLGKWTEGPREGSSVTQTATIVSSASVLAVPQLVVH